ncbi:hypothetical protein PRIPAC_96889 [Pristionchus pacificus]|uniref:Uncharacterized protein n=1 Tax=Pristionchus pacificus TaxID=54126 RepID=A0A2A6CH47_PRIPA|nr:hypothetical protein PRIPAC_96889 [Pristionchus pacificus]|eukprot:PDM77410.1 hypothetical protein PRIPAC_33140 [Pristionchus pacificus]
MIRVIQLIVRISQILCNRDTATDAGPHEACIPVSKPSSSSSSAQTTSTTPASYRGIQRRKAVRRSPTPRNRGQVEGINEVHPDPPTTY